MLLSQLSALPAGDDLEQLYWRARQLDAVVRAAHIEIAVQQAELTALRVRVAEQMEQLHGLQETLQTREADTLAKDRQIRRLRSEMRAVQDYVRTVMHGDR